MNKRYNMVSPRARRDGKTHWHTIGSAFEGDKGITLVFDSLPLPDAEGACRVLLMEPRDRDEGPRQSRRDDRRGASDDWDAGGAPF